MQLSLKKKYSTARKSWMYRKASHCKKNIYNCVITVTVINPIYFL